jgi:hypothetical protein
MMQVIRLKPYLRAMMALRFDEGAMREVEEMILAAPEAHPMIKGLRGARKARFARPGMGKSSGGRTIYYIALTPDRLFMMTAYPKNERDDLSQDQRRAILRAIESIKGAKL